MRRVERYSDDFRSCICSEFNYRKHLRDAEWKGGGKPVKIWHSVIREARRAARDIINEWPWARSRLNFLMDDNNVCTTVRAGAI